MDVCNEERLLAHEEKRVKEGPEPTDDEYFYASLHESLVAGHSCVGHIVHQTGAIRPSLDDGDCVVVSVYIPTIPRSDEVISTPTSSPTPALL